MHAPAERTWPRYLGKPFVGRDAFVADLTARFEDLRAIWLTGAPGVGKTRVAVRAAETWQSRARSARFVDLRDARDRSGLLRAVSAALDLGRSTSQRSATREIVEAVSDAILLVFDNADEVEAPLLELLSAIRAHKRVPCVITTRAVTHATTAEDVDFVDIPALQVARDTHGRSEPSEAAVFLLSRAAPFVDVRDFSEAERLDIERIALAVGGVPLALELVAPRLITSSAEELRAELEQNPLTEDDSSIALPALSEDETLALLGASVFALSFQSTDLEEVLHDTLARVRPAIESLARKNLLFVRKGEGKAPRFSIHLLVREEGRRQLKTRTDLGLERAHAKWALRRSIPFDASERADLAAEVGTAAARFASDVALATELACALERVDGVTSYDERDARLTRAIARDSGSADLHILRGHSRRLSGDPDGAERDFQCALAMREASERQRADARAGLGNVHALRAHWTLAEEQLESARALYPTNSREHARTLAMLASCAYNRDDFALAEARLHEAIRSSIVRSDREVEWMARASLGIVYLQKGDTERARPLLAEATSQLESQGFVHWAALSLSYLARLDLEEGLRGAREQLERAVSRLRAQHVEREAMIAGHFLACAHAHAGSANDAKSSWLACIDRARRVAPDHVALFLALLALLERSRGDEALARTWISGAKSEPVDRPLARAVLDVATRACAGEPEAATDFDASFEVKFARRLASAQSRAVRLTVEPEGAGFQVGDGEPVSLRTRHPLRRIFRALVDAHLAKQGRALPAGDAVAAGWPDERIDRDAALTRLYAAISTLRKLGLREILLQREEGYLLDPKVEVIERPRSVSG